MQEATQSISAAYFNNFPSSFTKERAMKQMSFPVAMKDYFGLKEGQNAMGFMQELKALTDDDKKWFRENLPSVGYEITNSMQAA